MLDTIFGLIIVLIIFSVREYIKTTKKMDNIAHKHNLDPITGEPLPKEIIFDGTFHVAGTYYYSDNIREILKVKKHTGDGYVYRIKEDYVILQPEPTNEHDPNAIIVCMNNQKIGYVPAELTHIIKPLLNDNFFVGVIRCGDKWRGDEIIEDSFICEVRIENFNED